MITMKNALAFQQQIKRNKIKKKAGCLNYLIREANSNESDKGICSHVTVSNKSTRAYASLYKGKVRNEGGEDGRLKGT